MPDTISVPAEAPARRSATAGLVRPLVAPANPGVRLAEIAHEAKLNLRGDLADFGAAAGRHAAVTNVTDNWTVIALAGPKALDVLAKGCPLDLHPRAFPAGSVAQSMICQADVVLHRADDVDGVPRLRIYVRRSFAQYLWDWLADAGLEYGVGSTD